MRRVGVRGSLLAGVSAAAILAFAVCPVAAEETAALSPDAGEAAPSQDDYYTQRAKRTLEAEKRATAAPHPLAARYPGMDIVVCEAGCAVGRGAQIVAARRQEAPVIANEGYMVTTSADAAFPVAGKSATDAACIAGCYGEQDKLPLSRALSVSAPTAPRMVLPDRDKLSPIR